MGLPLDPFSTTLSCRCSKPHCWKLSQKMTVSVALFWIWVFPPVTPSMTASLKTPFWTNLFIFLLLAPPISSSPRAQDDSFLRRIWSVHIVKSPLIQGITIYSVTTGTISYTLILFFPSAFIQPPSLVNVLPALLQLEWLSLTPFTTLFPWLWKFLTANYHVPSPSLVFGSVPHAPPNLTYGHSLENFHISAPVSAPEKFLCSECFLTFVAYPTNLPDSHPLPPC